jgi:TPR repeat protein
VAAPLLAKAAAEGNIRAVYYLRLLHERGLDGGPVRLDLAALDLNYLALRYALLQQLANDSPSAERPLFNAAMATLDYLGRNPEKKQDLERAVRLAKLAAEADFPPAYNLMAALTLDAAKEPETTSSIFGDRSACFDWTQKGLERKDILALGNASYLYRQGLGVEKNDFMASTLAHDAATAKIPSARALNDMGYVYEVGLGVTSDATEATLWYGLAAKRDYPLAKANLERLKSKASGPALAADLIEY